ncbi:MAG: hypothetical protein AB8H80_00640 [Planctomycetota bacterium]
MRVFRSILAAVSACFFGIAGVVAYSEMQRESAPTEPGGGLVESEEVISGGERFELLAHVPPIGWTAVLFTHDVDEVPEYDDAFGDVEGDAYEGDDGDGEEEERALSPARRERELRLQLETIAAIRHDVFLRTVLAHDLRSPAVVQYGVRELPTIWLFHDGRGVSRNLDDAMLTLRSLR